MWKAKAESLQSWFPVQPEHTNKAKYTNRSQTCAVVIISISYHQRRMIGYIHLQCD